MVEFLEKSVRKGTHVLVQQNCGLILNNCITNIVHLLDVSIYSEVVNIKEVVRVDVRNAETNLVYSGGQ